MTAVGGVRIEHHIDAFEEAPQLPPDLARVYRSQEVAEEVGQETGLALHGVCMCNLCSVPPHWKSTLLPDPLHLHVHLKHRGIASPVLDDSLHRAHPTLEGLGGPLLHCKHGGTACWQRCSSGGVYCNVVIAQCGCAVQ